MNGPIRLGFMVPVALLASCQYDPYTYSYAKARPSREQIIGIWLATEESLHRLRLQATCVPTLVVGEDGSIILRGVPTGWRGDVLAIGETVEDFAGRWSLERHQETWWGPTIRKADWGCYGCLMVMHDKAPHLLVLRYGDPDEGRGLEFERGRRTSGCS